MEGKKWGRNEERKERMKEEKEGGRRGRREVLCSCVS